MPAHHRRVRLRGVLVLALLLLVLLAGSTAAVAQWMARATNPANTFTAGRMEIEDSLAGSAILGASGLGAGSLVTGTVTITNGSTMPVSVTLGADNPQHGGSAGVGAAALSLGFVLHLEVRECGPSCSSGGSTAYSGPLDALPATLMPGNAPHALWAPGEAHRYLFSATLPATATDTLMGQSTSVDFVWSATSG